MVKTKQMKEDFMTNFSKILHQVLEVLSEKEVDKISKTDQSIILGVLTIVGGWQPKARGGS